MTGSPSACGGLQMEHWCHCRLGKAGGRRAESAGPSARTCINPEQRPSTLRSRAPPSAPQTFPTTIVVCRARPVFLQKQLLTDCF